MHLTDSRGNRVDESDSFTFTPPRWWDDLNGCHLRGRIVQIKRVITEGRYATVALKSCDKVFSDYIRDQQGIGIHFPLEWLTLID